MNRTILLLVGFGVVVIAFGLFNLSSKKTTETDTAQVQSNLSTDELNVDRTSGFAIYTNGTFRVFGASMYHNRSADVYLKADDPNIVYVKKSGLTWGDFFKTLPMKLTSDCLTTGTGQTFCSGTEGSLKFYLNGVRVDDFLVRMIGQGDRALITFGNENESEIQKQLQAVPQEFDL